MLQAITHASPNSGGVQSASRYRYLVVAYSQSPTTQQTTAINQCLSQAGARTTTDETVPLSINTVGAKPGQKLVFTVTWAGGSYGHEQLSRSIRVGG